MVYLLLESIHGLFVTLIRSLESIHGLFVTLIRSSWFICYFDQEFMVGLLLGAGVHGLVVA